MKTLRSLIPFTKGRRLAIGGGLAGSLLVTAAELARPFPLKLVVDWVFADPDPQAEGGFLLGVGALVLAIAVVGAVGGYLVEAGMRRAGEHVVHDLRVALYAHLQRLTLRFHHRRPTGDLVTRITGDVNSVRELVAESLIKVVSSILLLAGMLTVSAMLDPVLTLAAAAVTPILAFATVRSRRAIKRAARRQRNADGDIASISTESLAAISTVKALGTESAEQARLREKSEERREAGVAGSNLEGRFSGLVHILEAVGTAVVLVLGVVRVSSGALTPGDLVIMHSYVRRLYRPLHELARQSGRVARAMARADRIVEVLSADDHLPEADDAHRGPHAAGHLEFRDVTFSYRDDRPVLDGASIDVEAGTTLAIVGPSGAGKSTLATLIARFHDPDSGAVLLDGRDLRDCDLQWLRDQVGFVLQHTALFSGSVADNIAYGTDASRPQIVMAAHRAGAHEFIDDLPEGYDTILGPDGIGLSGGQAQRVAIARVLLRDPAVVVLDEPTSGLDATSEATVINSLDGLLGGRTTILITHSLRLARRADRVVVLDRGRIAEQGRPGELLAGHGLFRQLATQQGLAAAPRLPAPPDEALAQLPALLDPSVVSEALSDHMGESLRIDGVSLRYVRYKPRTNVVADYDVVTASGTYRAVLMAAADRDLSKRCARPQSRALADKAADRAPEHAPLGYLSELNVLLQWLPLDVWLPALAEPADELVRRAGVSADRLGDATLLAYKPRRRAVLGIDGHVFKLYADEHDFRAATTALMSGHRLPIRTASPTGVAADLRLTAQRRLDGTPLSDPVAAASAAGSLLAELHRAPPLPSMRALDPMDRTMATASTVSALLPHLSKRVDALVGELAATAPDPGTSLCHGDFHARQLLTVDEDLALIDLDDLGLGQPGGDLATFAAHLIDGTATSFDRAEAALEGLVDGYGHRPDALCWHLAAATLRRAVFPFRTYPTPDWPERVESMITMAEQAVRP